MDRKELIAILILAVLVGLVALLRLTWVPTPGTLGASEPASRSRTELRPTTRMPPGGGPPRLLWPENKARYEARDPEARSYFDAAERVMSEAFQAAREEVPDKELFGAAIPIYRRFITRYKNEPTVEIARFRVAQCLTVSERYLEAAHEYDLFLERHPRSPLRAIALLWSGDSHENSGNTALARGRFEEVIATATGPLEQEARRRLARLGPPQDGEEDQKD